MAYHVRNPARRALRERLYLQEQSPKVYEVIRGDTQNRVTNFSNDNKQETNDNGMVLEDGVFATDPNQPVVTYSTRKPNYPTGYSCEHSLLYERDNVDKTVANVVEMLSHSEDTSNDQYSISLNEVPVRLSIEFQVSIENPDDYDDIVSNVEALQWSFLNKISASTGLSKGCRIENQYDERTLVTALTNINERDSAFTDERGTSNDSTSDNFLHSNDQNNNRRRNSEVQSNRHLLSTLPFPTGVYSIKSTRPKWTASCSSEIVDDKGKCFTAEINFLAKCRGSTGESNLVEEYIQSIIHNQIALDPTQLFAENITGLKWIPNRDASTNTDQSTQTPIYFGPDFSLDRENDVDAISAPPTEKSNFFVVNLIIPIGTAVLVGAIWFCIHMYFLRKQQQGNVKDLQQVATEDSDDGKEDIDIETGSAGTELTRDLQSKASTDTQEYDEGKSCTEAMVNAIGCSSLSLSTAASAAPSSPTRSKTRTSCPISVDSSERSSAGLPPRPLATKRTVSTQLKKKRRKKKKKKKVVLSMTRVNSRDNITELPMISESDSECDSQYISSDEDEYCDDGSSYAASSGCSTPERSSRDDRQSFEFLMEAPGLEAPVFSKDLFSEGGIGVDQNLSTKVSLKTGETSEIEMKPRPADPPAHTKKEGPSDDDNDNDNDRGTFEIDESAELSNSFSEEHGNVMERMLPLPWLAKPTNNKRPN